MTEFGELHSPYCWERLVNTTAKKSILIFMIYRDRLSQHRKSVNFLLRQGIFGMCYY